MSSATEMTAEDILYNAGVTDAITEIKTGQLVYSGPSGEISLDAAYAYMDGRTWAWNNREVAELP